MPVWEQLLRQNHPDDPNDSLKSMMQELIGSVADGVEENFLHVVWDTSVTPAVLHFPDLYFFNVTINGVHYPEYQGMSIPAPDLTPFVDRLPSHGDDMLDYLYEHFI